MSDRVSEHSRHTRILMAVLGAVALVAIFSWSFLFMRDSSAPRPVIALVALLVGVGGIWGLFLTADHLVGLLPARTRDLLRPYVFITPAFLILLVYIIYPTVRTIYISFFDFQRGGTPINFGFQNYLRAFTDPALRIALRNNALWLVFVPLFAVSLGLVIAVLVDRIKWERFAKSLIFLPMAISFVGASVIWRFIYYRASFGTQIGLLNALRVALGEDPLGWLRLEPWNNFFLIIIMIWLQTGFAMVILSSAVKGVPSSLLEAARIDGAGEFRIFFQVIIPFVSGAILTVTTTIVILVLKVFDVVYVMTSGRFNTEVVANMMYNQMFVQGAYGRGAALAVIIFIAVTPVMIYNIRRMNQV
ncbi:alpha-glucoside transport system permease protein [Alkalispirochaeta americana]|uniref:Alpha-glucoside transport system permease protein n=1 Tax=Alkalispirochaeta americana TaxID=159291 RepID=A0A1N6RYU4_9SPIO|nr:sugar ABC transporter permease [Alkalispirochaeta americana]SIQ34033.1 alpha-glucoside transport system permease protein [Alkalispirochaeta americana]